MDESKDNSTAESSKNILSRVPKLNSPIILKTLHVWRDGGSLGFVISGRMGKNISFMIDRRIGSNTKGYVFLNTTYNQRVKGIMLPIGGKEELQLMDYLSSWLYSNYDKKTLGILFKTPNFKTMSPKEFKAFHVSRLLKSRQKLR